MLESVDQRDKRCQGLREVGLTLFPGMLTSLPNLESISSKYVPSVIIARSKGPRETVSELD